MVFYQKDQIDIYQIIGQHILKKAKDINIKSINNKNFIDMSNMGVGASVLGYSNNFVNKEVKKQLIKELQAR